MTARGSATPIAIAAALGAALWFAASALTGKREPWDSSAYWLVAYPAAILASALLGYAHPARPWRWVAVLFLAQFVAMCIRNGELGNLWPLGMALFAVIALPGVLVAHLASRFNRSSAEKSG